MDEKPPASISGELLKKKHETDEWHKRWFAIEGSDMNWYDDSHSDVPRGTVSLKALLKCDMRPADSELFLLLPERDIYVRAKSEGEMSMWHRAIEMYADIAREG